MSKCVLEYKYNSKLKKIIKLEGITEFLNKENNIAQTIHCENTVISTGGSMVYNMDALYHFKNNLNCKIIHLYLSLPEFKNRVGNLEERGVINKYGLTLHELYIERIRLCNLYSDITINADNKYETIKKLLKE